MNNEQGNRDLILTFIASWSALEFNPNNIVDTYLASDASVRFLDKFPPINDSALIKETWKSFRANGETVTSKIHSTYAKGPIVVVHRTDIQMVPDRDERHFQIVGFFVVSNGKIKEWTDYLTGGDEDTLGDSQDALA